MSGYLPDLTLKIGVDASLFSEISVISHALGAIQYIQMVSVNQEQAIDCLIGRFIPAHQSSASSRTNLPPVGSIGLFTQDLSLLNSAFFGRADEPAVDAVNRLKPTLKLLLVEKIFEDLAATSSNLHIQGEIFSASGQGPRIQISSRADGENNRPLIRAIASSSQAFKAGDALQLQVENLEEREVYLSCLMIDDTAKLTVLYPLAGEGFNAPEEAGRMGKRSSIANILVVPPPNTVELRLRGSGFLTLLMLISTAPLRTTLKALQTIAEARGIRGFQNLEEDEPNQVIDHLLSDLSEMSRSAETGQVPGGDLSLNTNMLTAFSTVIQIQE
ncbi:MAG: DUF4384 domain-containing protein [Leptolyngbyaceae cyanobacterium CRU_2_3]|nr:DUF4384 domain-containing protein [Leptolyngbyaceae cyanobacterium CRU_2_3]